MSQLADLVATSGRVAGTRSRRAKIEILGSYLAGVDEGSLTPAVALLTGVIPLSPLGVGWATIGQPPDPADEPTLAVRDLIGTLRRIAETSGAGSNAVRRELVTGLMAVATEAEQRFLFGLITGEIRQGALEGVMVEAVAHALELPAGLVRRATMLNGRIWEVAAIGRAGGANALDAVGLTLFRPIKPMLAQSAPDVTGAMERTGAAAVEWKLDGIRIQVHRDGDRVEIYTRNLNPVTDRLDDIVAEALGLPCETVVLDGEALFLGPAGDPGRFQETAGRFGTDAMAERGLRAFYFDLLHVDGEDLIDLPLRIRRRRLEALTGGQAVPSATVTSAEEAEAVLAQALDRRHEGVMVKALDSAYEAGRRGAAWVKVKPVLTLDLVVLGAEWGHGRRQGWLSNLHLGARGTDGPVMVGKTFKGMTDELLDWQTSRLQEIETRRTQATVFVDPVLVVEIALDGVQVSTRYPGGVALRFARVRGYRPDKDPDEADTIETVRAMAGL